MTISFSLAPNPKWYIANKSGLPLGGGFLASYRSLNKSQQKLIFQDPAGMFPWPSVAIPNTSNVGILFDMNGSQGPFYFEFDTMNPQETYYLEVYDFEGILQWTIDNFTSNGGSGGSVITTAVDLENLIINNVMSRNIGATSMPITTTAVLLAPGSHSRFALTPANAGGDINFIKNNTNAADQITFVPFPLGLTPLLPDVTPTEYLNYVCGNSPSGETFKYVQFPITAKVQNLSGSQVTFTVWAMGSTNATLTLQLLQFFGDGGGSSSITTPLQTFTLTSTWSQFTVTAVVPSVAGKTIGNCFNDGLFLQAAFPLGVPCNISFTKPSAFLGAISPSQDYHTYDMTDGVINAPRTGDVVTTYNFSTAPGGWISMNDGTIGNLVGASSSNATTRANGDTFPLYNLLWNNTTNANCPLFNSGGTAINRGASAIADFIAFNALSLPKALGRTFSQVGQPSANSSTPFGGGVAAGISWGLGLSTGFELHQQSIPELASHAHITSFPITNQATSLGSPVVATADFIASATQFATVADTGSNMPFSVQQPTTYAVYLIKL